MSLHQWYRGEYFISIIQYSIYPITSQTEMAFGPCAAYIVDVLHSRSAESLAAHV